MSLVALYILQGEDITHFVASGNFCTYCAHTDGESLIADSPAINLVLVTYIEYVNDRRSSIFIKFSHCGKNLLKCLVRNNDIAPKVSLEFGNVARTSLWVIASKNVCGNSRRTSDLIASCNLAEIGALEDKISFTFCFATIFRWP